MLDRRGRKASARRRPADRQAGARLDPARCWKRSRRGAGVGPAGGRDGAGGGGHGPRRRPVPAGALQHRRGAVEYRLLRRIIFDEIHAAAAQSGLRRRHAGGHGDRYRAAPGRRQSSSAPGRAAEVRRRGRVKYLTYLSHDLRNNLNAVTLTLEGLRQSLANSPNSRRRRGHPDLRNAVFETIEGMDRLLQAERLRKAVE